jgi:hypothetical protein
MTNFRSLIASHSTGCHHNLTLSSAEGSLTLNSTVLSSCCHHGVLVNASWCAR